ncbi:MAG: MFS transporter [Micromonosporaceae bacterium]
MTALTVAQVRRRYLFLHGLRWLPVGFLIPATILLLLERGLTLSQAGLIAATQGVTVLILEIPTGGLADAVGRRPVLLLAGMASLASLILFAVADHFLVFLLCGVLLGIFRALDSGPLDAWYVDAVLAADPKAKIEGGLSAAGAVLSTAIATGALTTSGIIALNPLPAVGALTLPVWVAAVVQAGGIVAIAALMRDVRPQRSAPGASAGSNASASVSSGAPTGGSEPGAPTGGEPAAHAPNPRERRTVAELCRSQAAALADVPAVISGAWRLLRRSRILFALLTVELLWGFGSVTFETLMPIRLADVVGSTQTAAALMGPAGTAAWLVSALGAGLAPVVSRFTGVPVAAGLLLLTQGVAVAGMGIIAGPIGVVAAFIGTYLMHGAVNPLHQTLLHRQVDGPYRATVLSMNSMMGQTGMVAGSVALTAVADAVSTSAAIVAGAMVIAAASPLFLPARRPAQVQPSRAAAGPLPGHERARPTSASSPAAGEPRELAESTER